MSLQEGYYKVFQQDWWEDEDSKTGWTNSGWNVEKDYELVEYLEEDKFGNPVKALFRYEGPVYLGIQHAAYNIQARFLNEFIDIAKASGNKTYKEIIESNERFLYLSKAIDLFEEFYNIKEYLSLK